jgi:hypothetical protein
MSAPVCRSGFGRGECLVSQEVLRIYSHTTANLRMESCTANVSEGLAYQASVLVALYSLHMLVQAPRVSPRDQTDSHKCPLSFVGLTHT